MTRSQENNGLTFGDFRVIRAGRVALRANTLEAVKAYATRWQDWKPIVQRGDALTGRWEAVK